MERKVASSLFCAGKRRERAFERYRPAAVRKRRDLVSSVLKRGGGSAVSSDPTEPR